MHEVPLDNFRSANPYDVVVLSNVLEDTLDPTQYAFDATRILKSGGEVWISCPNSRSWLRGLFGRSWINWHVPFHVSHFLLKLCSNPWITGFTRIEIRQRTPAAWVAASIIVTALAWARQSRPATSQSARSFASLMLLIRALLFPHPVHRQPEKEREIAWSPWLGSKVD